MAALAATAAVAACGGDSTGPTTQRPVTNSGSTSSRPTALTPGFAAKTLGLAAGDGVHDGAHQRLERRLAGGLGARLVDVQRDDRRGGPDRSHPREGQRRRLDRRAERAVRRHAQGHRQRVRLLGHRGARRRRGAALPRRPGSSCITGAERDEYVLVTFNTDQDSARVTNDQRAALNVTANGIADITPTAGEALAPEEPSALRALLRNTTADLPRRDAAFDLGLRVRAGRDLTARLAAAHANTGARTGASLSLAPSRPSALAVPTVGQLLSLNTSLETCDTSVVGGIKRRTGRVVAITDKAIVLADTGNPAGGFTRADYRRFASRFDQLVYPLDL